MFLVTKGILVLLRLLLTVAMLSHSLLGCVGHGPCGTSEGCCAELAHAVHLDPHHHGEAGWLHFDAASSASGATHWHPPQNHHDGDCQHGLGCNFLTGVTSVAGKFGDRDKRRPSCGLAVMAARPVAREIGGMGVADATGRPVTPLLTATHRCARLCIWIL